MSDLWWRTVPAWLTYSYGEERGEPQAGFAVDVSETPDGPWRPASFFEVGELGWMLQTPRWVKVGMIGVLLGE